MRYAVAPSPRHLVWAALPSMSEHHPGQQMDGRVLLSAQQYKEILGPTRTGKVG